MVYPISFDRAAEYYDETRGFPPGISDLVVGSLVSELRSDDHILELGIGTGRIAIPLLARKFKISGIDISRGMMRRLQRNAASACVHIPDLVEGDATLLPFAHKSLDTVLAVHVLHLIPAWQAVISEVLRVLSPQGNFVLGYESHPADTPYDLIRNHFEETVLSRGFDPRRHVKRDFEDVHQRFREENAVKKEWVACEWTSTQSPAHALDRFESRKWSSTWNIPEAIFQESIEQLRSWVDHAFPDLDRVYSIPTQFIWRKYYWPGNDQSGHES